MALSDDILYILLNHYAPCMRPMVIHANWRWRDVVLADPRPEVHPNALSRIVLRAAAHGGVGLLRWIYGREEGQALLQRRGSDGVTALMCAAAKYGHASVIDMCDREWTNTQYTASTVLGIAAWYGRSALVEALVARMRSATPAVAEIDILEPLVRNAARQGRDTLLRQWLVGENVPLSIKNVALRAAALGGQLATLRFVHEEFGADDFGMALRSAAHGGHLHVLEHLWPLIWKSYPGEMLVDTEARMFLLNGAIESAVFGVADERVLRCLKEWGATSIRGCLSLAVERGHVHVLHLCKEWGINDWNDALVTAAQYGHIDVIRLCRAWGATDLRDALHSARLHKRVHVVRMFKEEWHIED